MSTLELLLRQFRDPIVYVLAAVGVAAGALGEVVEAIAVTIALLLQAAIGFATELRAKQSVDCLLYTSPSPRDRQKSRMPSSA